MRSPDLDDLGPARERLRLFLAEYWGGPTTYFKQRGHPRLRMRHQPFVIDDEARDRWLAAMGGALDELNPATPFANALADYFTMAADTMRDR